MDLRFRRLEPGCYSIEVDDEEVGAVLQYVEPGVRHWDILWDNHPDDEGDNWRR